MIAACEEISAHISGMQSASRDSVASIKEIGATIARITAIATSVSAAVEEQDARCRDGGAPGITGSVRPP